VRINYNHLRYFWYVAHEGHLTNAAKALNISQSALSVQIKTLEAQLGHELFERRGRKLLLTEAGRMVLDYADSIFQSGEDLLYQLAHSGEVHRRVFRVGAITTLSRNFQIQFLRPLLELEDIELVITSGSLGELLRELDAHNLDVALTNFVPHRDAGSPWASYLIDQQPVSLVGPPTIDPNNRSLQELLSSEPLILPSLDSNIRLGFDALLEQWGIRPNIVAEINDMTMLRVMAKEKIGLAVVPPIVVREELEQGLIGELYQIPKLLETFHAIVPKRRFPNPLLKKLLPR
jgi:LysR family transcriptional activator of nhaA